MWREARGYIFLARDLRNGRPFASRITVATNYAVIYYMPHMINDSVIFETLSSTDDHLVTFSLGVAAFG